MKVLAEVLNVHNKKTKTTTVRIMNMDLKKKQNNRTKGDHLTNNQGIKLHMGEISAAALLMRQRKVMW